MTTLTIPEVDTRLTYLVGVDPTSQFTVPFPFFELTDIEVSVDGAPLLYGTDYSVAGIPEDGGYSGGTVTTVIAYTNVEVLVYRRIPLARLTNFPNAGPFNIDQLNNELNRFIAIAQQLLNLTGLFLSLPETAAASTPWDAAGRALTGLADNADPTAAATRGFVASLGVADNQIYFSPSPPSPPVGGFRAGDLWFDTDDNNHPYVWDPTLNGGLGDWNSVRDGTIAETNALAAQAITDAANANANADGKVNTYYSSFAPWPNGSTAHDVDEGDLWFNTTEQKLYRWASTSDLWVLIEDAGITDAISQAQSAQATADGKIVTFYTGVAPTAEGIGDLWFDTSDGNRQYRWSGASWVEVRDADIDVAVANAAQAITNAATAQATADGKVTTFYSATPPTAEGVGDLWVRTADDRLFRWDGGSWVEVQDAQIAQAISDAQNAQTTADGKIVSFYTPGPTPPTADGVGDLWFDTADNSRLYRWNGSSWVDVLTYTLQEAIDAAANAQATADGKVTTFFQASQPTAEGVGDLWLRTTDGRLFRWDGATWVEIQDADIATAITDAATAQSTADGKIVTYYQNTPPWPNGSTTHDIDNGDFWIDTDDSNRPYRWDSVTPTFNRLWQDVTPIQAVVGGQVGGGGIQNNAIGSNHIVASSIQTKHLTVGNFGKGMNRDPGTSDATAWVTQGGSNWGIYTGITDGRMGRTALGSTGAPGNAWVMEVTHIEIDPTKVYKLHTWARRLSGNRGVYLAMDFFDGTGTRIIGSSAPAMQNWKGRGTMFYWGLAGDSGALLPADSVWREFTHTMGPIGNTFGFAEIPSNAQTCRIGAILNLSAVGTTDGVVQLQDIRINDDADSTQTVIDGGLITTGFIELDTAGHIRSGKATYADSLAGFWLGSDAGTPKFKIGDAGGANQMSWDGTNLKVTGQVYARNFAVGETLILSANTERSEGGLSTEPDLIFVLKKEFFVTRGGTVRVRVTSRYVPASGSTAQQPVYQIRGGGILKVTQTINTTSNTTRAHDFTFSVGGSTDTIQVYLAKGWGTTSGGGEVGVTGYVLNCRVYNAFPLLDAVTLD